MKEKVNIICILWVGNFRGRDFTAIDVERLHASVEKHIDRDYDFFCLTNYTKPLPAHKIPLTHPEWPGWWAKVELHRPDLLDGRTLYMDLDSHAVRSLQPILDYPGDLVMFDTRIDLAKQSKLAPEGWVLRYQAATMLFTPGCAPMQLVWNRFNEAPDKWMKAFRSEQDMMGAWIPEQPTFPKQWMLKLESCKNMTVLPDDVIIVTGQPTDGTFRKLETKLPWLEKMARS